MFGCCCNQGPYKWKYAHAKPGGVRPVITTNRAATGAGLTDWNSCAFVLPSFLEHSWRSYNSITFFRQSGPGATQTVVWTKDGVLSNQTTGPYTVNTTTDEGFAEDWAEGDIDTNFIFDVVFMSAHSIDWEAGTETYTLLREDSTNQITVTCEGLVRDQDVYDALKVLLDAIDWASLDDPTPTEIGGEIYNVPDDDGAAGYGFVSVGTAIPPVTVPTTDIRAYALRMCERRTIAGKTLSLFEIMHPGGCTQTSTLNNAAEPATWALESLAAGVVAIEHEDGANDLMQDVAELQTYSVSEAGPSGTNIYSSDLSDPSSRQVAGKLIVPYNGAKKSEAAADTGYEHRYFLNGAQLRVAEEEQEGCEEDI